MHLSLVPSDNYGWKGSFLQTHFYVRISGGATVWHLGKMYLIGGYSIEYDVELKSFYQNPTNSGKCL